MSRYKTCPECGELAHCMTLLSDPPQEQWQCIACGWKSEPVCLYVNQENPDVSTSAHCADCGMEYGTFPDLILPDDVWARIAPREGRYGILCPTCIAKRLDKIGLWYKDGYYNRKGWSAFNPLAEQVESLQVDNARLQAELSALRADIEAGRLVRVPCKVGDTVYVVSSCDDVIRRYDNDYLNGTGSSECPFENQCKFEDCNATELQVFEATVRAYWFENDLPGGYEVWVENLDCTFCDKDFGRKIFLSNAEAEQAARAAKEDGNA